MNSDPTQSLALTRITLGHARETRCHHCGRPGEHVSLRQKEGRGCVHGLQQKYRIVRQRMYNYRIENVLPIHDMN